MGRKDTLATPLALAESLAASFIGPATIVQFGDNYSYQINVTTTDSTGTFSVQSSDDYKVVQGVVVNPGNWVTLTLSGVPTVAAANQEILISLNQVTFVAMRLNYTSTVAGTGVADIYINGRMIGG